MAGQFSTVAERRAHTVGFENHRAASLDVSSSAPPTPGTNGTSNGVKAQSQPLPPADLMAASIPTIINSARMNGNDKVGSPQKQKFLCPSHSQIRFGRLNFLITHMPTENAIDNYIADLERYHCKTLIRVCDVNYSSDKLAEHGIRVHDWQFDDGSPPPAEVISKFVQLCLETFSGSQDCVAIHCVAGLGRAPVLVGIALLEAGMKCDDAVFLIRSQRRGALNSNQLEFLRNYKPSSQLKKLRYLEIKQRKSCAIM